MRPKTDLGHQPAGVAPPASRAVLLKADSNTCAAPETGTGCQEPCSRARYLKRTPTHSIPAGTASRSPPKHPTPVRKCSGLRLPPTKSETPVGRRPHGPVSVHAVHHFRAFHVRGSRLTGLQETTWTDSEPSGVWPRPHHRCLSGAGKRARSSTSSAPELNGTANSRPAFRSAARSSGRGFSALARQIRGPVRSSIDHNAMLHNIL